MLPVLRKLASTHESLGASSPVAPSINYKASSGIHSHPVAPSDPPDVGMTSTPSSPETSQGPSPPVQFPIDNDADARSFHSPRTPSTGSVDFPLLSDAQARSLRSHTVSPPFVSSPLNPNAPTPLSAPATLSIRPRTKSRQSMIFNRVPSEESQALASHRSSLTPNRSSMILYRLSDGEEQPSSSPPYPTRQSLLSSSGDSTLTVSYDSKYPYGAHTPRKFTPYPFDPSQHIDTPEDDDALHDPSDNTPTYNSSGIAVRGFLNIGVLIFVILALLCLFIFYPIWHFVIQGNGTIP